MEMRLDVLSDSVEEAFRGEISRNDPRQCDAGMREAKVRHIYSQENITAVKMHHFPRKGEKLSSFRTHATSTGEIPHDKLIESRNDNEEKTHHYPKEALSPTLNPKMNICSN